MRIVICLFAFFAFSFTSTALDLPENPPDDFFVSYEVKGIIAHEATHITDFKFTASALGGAFLEFKGKEGATFNIDVNSVKKLYNAVRAGNFFDNESQPQPEYAYDSLSRGVDADEEHASYSVSRDIHIIADGVERKWIDAKFGGDWDRSLREAVFDILDENRPGWRDN